MLTSFEFYISVRGGTWETIPEEIFYDSLYRHVTKITPYIKHMLTGEIVTFGSRKYRIVPIAKKEEEKND